MHVLFYFKQTVSARSNAATPIFVTYTVTTLTTSPPPGLGFQYPWVLVCQTHVPRVYVHPHPKVTIVRVRQAITE